jgi:hypothetical protein
MIRSFKNARTSVKYEEGAGRRPAYITDANTERVRDMILRNRLVITDKVAQQLQISHGSGYEIIHNRHAFHNVCAMSLRGTQNFTNRNVWTFANVFWSAMVLMATTSWKETSREMKHGSTITRKRVNARVRNPPHPPKKFKRIQPQKSYVYSFGTHKGY